MECVKEYIDPGDRWLPYPGSVLVSATWLAGGPFDTPLDTPLPI